MYRKESEGFLKHYDFVLLDMLCLQLAFILAYLIYGNGSNPYETLLYRNIAIFIEFADLLTLFSLNTLKYVLKRGYYKELMRTIYNDLCVGAMTIVYLFLLHQAQEYSRLTLMLMIILYIGLSYSVRIVWKDRLKKKMKDRGERSLLILTTSDIAAEVVKNIKENNYGRFRITGVVLADRDGCGGYIEDIPVAATEETAALYVCREWIDEVLVVTSCYPAFYLVLNHTIFPQIKKRHSINYSDGFFIRLLYAVPFVVS